MQEPIQYTLSDVGPFQNIYPCFILHYHNRAQESKTSYLPYFMSTRISDFCVSW